MNPSAGLTPPARLLAILILVYVFSLVDRSIIGILAKPIQADLPLDDIQPGLLGGMVGIAAGGVVGDRLGRKSLKPLVLIPAISFLLSAPLYALAFFSPNLGHAWFLFMVPQALAFLYPGPMLTALNHVVPPNMRATASAFFLMIANLVGTGLGTVVIGILSDAMSTSRGAEGLRYALPFAVGANVLAAFAFAGAAGTIGKDWKGQRPGGAQPA